MKTVKSLTDLEGVQEIYVKAVCPKCKKEFTSLLDNARNILKYGCVLCSDEWQATVIDLSGLSWSDISPDNCMDCGRSFEDENIVPLRMWQDNKEIAICNDCMTRRLKTPERMMQDMTKGLFVTPPRTGG